MAHLKPKKKKKNLCLGFVFVFLSSKGQMDRPTFGWKEINEETEKKRENIFGSQILSSPSISSIHTVGSKNLATPAHFILNPRPTPRKEKCPRTNEESPNFQAASPRTILSSANRDYRREERHAIKGSLAEYPKKKDKYCGSAMGAWWRSNSGRNCHLRIKCPQLTFWPH